jgi:hypothetical protein
MSRALARRLHRLLLTVLYTGTFINNFLLTAESYSIQLACQTREANKQGKFTFMHLPSFHTCSYVMLSIAMCALNAMQQHKQISHSTCPQMPRPHANWDDAETKLLLDMCLQEKDKSSTSTSLV